MERQIWDRWIHELHGVEWLQNYLPDMIQEQLGVNLSTWKTSDPYTSTPGDEDTELNELPLITNDSLVAEIFRTTSEQDDIWLALLQYHTRSTIASLAMRVQSIDGELWDPVREMTALWKTD